MEDNNYEQLEDLIDKNVTLKLKAEPDGEQEETVSGAIVEYTPADQTPDLKGFITVDLGNYFRNIIINDIESIEVP